MPEAQPALSEEKTLPIEDTGDSVDVELKDVVEEATKEIGLVQTRSPSETPKLKQATCKALVALLVECAYLTPQ